MSKTLVIGDTSPHTAHYAINIDKNAQLVDESTFDVALNKKEGVFYSALGDLDFNKLKKLAISCDCIQVTDAVKNFTEKSAFTHILLNHLSHFKNISGFEQGEPNLFLKKPVSRKYQEPTLWTFGCSHTAGTGLVDPDNECWGRVLADRLEMPWQNVSCPGTSTLWSLTHMLHADLGPDDIIVWATTAAERDRIALADNIIKEMQVSDMSRDLIGYYSDEQLLFRHIDIVNTGIKYLRTSKKKFIFFSMVPKTGLFYKIEKEFSLHPEWCPLVDWFLDYATDGSHGGVKSNRFIAELAYEHLRLLKLA